ncbi:LysM peptidoglycan-binding domain-containing protein [Luteimonas sp. SX5]|uniref:LysM peptidoglycan-binding domain-containing protein n=1 Tax=Luteimonas galliterrae TaxID=2940486 RepID=A0ABT0MNA8_9GAMM|nr:M23 family metallopeptidase [Luteimonas galliterrae]MCL1636173.1 LysM peptidoglycan-binding domain-containing protein [Luteimonas galliterrae]
MVQPVGSSENRPGDHLSPSGFDYNRIDGVQGNRNVTSEFITEVEAMAQRLGTRPEYILAVMSFETGGSFSPGQRNNAGSGATGLIQFMPNTARELGTSTDALARMSAVDQLQYVERYFNNRSDPGELNTLEGVYTAVLYGSPRPDPNSTLFSQGSAAYRANAPLDTNRDGRITAGEATSFVRGRINGEAPPPTDTPPGNGDTPPQPSPRTGTVTVHRGETLSGIARENGVSLPALIAANPQIRNPNLIYPGQTVHLPGGGDGSVRVQSGDTLTGIAQRNGVSLSALLQANPQYRSNPDLIYPNQVVRIPGGGSSTPTNNGGGTDQPAPQPPSGDVRSYSPYTVYSTGERAAFAVSDPDQLQPHHDYQTQTREGQRLEVRDVVLHHNGQSQTRQAIPSPIAGTVVSAGPMGNAGNAVVLRGEQGQLVYIFHMSSIDVRAGQRVTYGQDLGNQGSTGNSTGPHVHIEASPQVIDRWVNDLLDGRFDGRRG